VASSLELVLAQRLVRVICKHCREETPVADLTAMRAEFGAQVPEMVYRGRGCRQCMGTGFRGGRGCLSDAGDGGDSGADQWSGRRQRCAKDGGAAGECRVCARMAGGWCARDGRRLKRWCGRRRRNKRRR